MGRWDDLLDRWLLVGAQLATVDRVRMERLLAIASRVVEAHEMDADPVSLLDPDAPPVDEFA
jgi:hypothetical protein